MIIVIKANTERELNRLVTVTNLPDGVYLELDDSSGSLVYQVFTILGGKREEKGNETDATLSLADAVSKFKIEYILVTATGVDVNELTASLVLANHNSIAYSVEEFVSHKVRPLN